jgi:ectoine hydroxylase-related dioxygenase (phytanoyl-CoA dioxygenase family)
MDSETAAQPYSIEVTPQEHQQRKLIPEHLRIASLLLHTQGYVILRKAVPEEIAQSARTEFQRIYHDCLRSREGDGWYQVARETKAVFWERNCRWRIFPKLRGTFQSPWMIANPFAGELLLQFLGDDYYCKFVSSDTCLKGAVMQAPHRELGAGKTWEPRSYVVNIPIGFCGLDNAPLEIWPAGTHLWNNQVIDRWKLDTDVQDGSNPEMDWFASLFPSRRVVLEPGDLLIRDPGLLHRGTVNRTEHPRTMLTLCYFKQNETHDYGEPGYNLDREMWEQLDSAVKSLFAPAFAP